MQVWTRVSSWHRILAPARLSSIQCMHHMRRGCGIRSQIEIIPRLSYPSRSHHRSSAHMVSSPTQETTDEYRLPTNVKPAHYDVTIKTDIENQLFEGFVQIEWEFSVLDQGS